jgi:CBS domain-containing protein
MPVEEHMRRDPVTVDADASVREAAKLMETRSTGCVVTLGSDGKPNGVLTDRDIALRVLRRGLDPDETSIASVKEPDLVTINPRAALTSAMRKMRSYGVRRLPVVDSDGALLGIFDWNDAVRVLSSELHHAARVAGAQA